VKKVEKVVLWRDDVWGWRRREGLEALLTWPREWRNEEKPIDDIILSEDYEVSSIIEEEKIEDMSEEVVVIVVITVPIVDDIDPMREDWLLCGNCDILLLLKVYCYWGYPIIDYAVLLLK